MRKLSALVLIAALGGCSWFTSAAKNGKDAAIDCAKQDLGQTVGEAAVSIAMDVITIIATGGLNWEADLEALGAKFGPEALACAEKIAEAVFRTPITMSPGTAMSKDLNDLLAAHARAQSRIEGKTFK